MAGLFSRDRVATAASVSALFEEVPETDSAVVLSAVLSGEKIATKLTNFKTKSLPYRSEIAFAYAKNTYTLGLPNSKNTGWSTKVSSGDYKAIESVLGAQLGTRVSVKSCTVGEPDALFIARDHLLSQGWDPATNQLSNPPFSTPPLAGPVRLDGISVSGNNTIKIRYRYVFVFAIYRRKYVTIPVNANGVYIHAVYQRIDDAGSPIGNEEYWSYDTTTKQHPLLDRGDILEGSNEYYPFIPLRTAFQDMSQQTFDPDLLRTSRQLCFLLGIQFDKLCKSINEGLDDYAANYVNEDDADVDVEVDDAYLIFGVSLHKDSMAVRRYLYDFFSSAYSSLAATKGDYDAWSDSLRLEGPPYNIIDTRDSGAQLSVRYSYITLATKTGVVCAVGDVVMDTTIREPGDEIYSAGEFGFTYERSSITIKKQVAANTYSEVYVYGLQHSYRSASEPFITTLETSKNAAQGADSFLIPINRSLIINMAIEDKNELLHNSFQLVSIADFDYEVEWYQTTAFFLVALVVALILFSISLGQIGGLYGSLLASGMTTVGAVVVTALITIGTGAAVQAIGTWLINDTNLEEYFLGQVFLAFVFVTAIVVTGGRILKDIPWAADFILMSSAIIGAGISAETERQVKEVTEELEDLGESYTNDLKLLKELEEELDVANQVVIDIYRKPGKIININESPSDFYNRTIHSGNVGTLSLNVIEQYVDLKLRLPDPEPTYF